MTPKFMHITDEKGEANLLLDISCIEPLKIEAVAESLFISEIYIELSLPNMPACKFGAYKEKQKAIEDIELLVKAMRNEAEKFVFKCCK